jgi:hypothetical protein
MHAGTATGYADQKSVGLIQDQSPRYFIHFTTTPIASALRTPLYLELQGLLEVPTGFLSHFYIWIQVPGGDFTFETTARRFQK